MLHRELEDLIESEGKWTYLHFFSCGNLLPQFFREVLNRRVHVQRKPMEVGLFSQLEQEETVSSCTRGGLDWIAGTISSPISSPKGFSNIE